MDRKKLVLLLVALVVAVGTAFAARSMFAGASSPEAQAVEAEAKGPKVLVEQRALPAGTIITADAQGFQKWTADRVKADYFIEGECDHNHLHENIVRTRVQRAQPVNPRR